MALKFLGKKIIIGSRASPLAMAQTQLVINAWQQFEPQQIFEILPISTSGDEWLITSLSELGGKGLFTKELDQALLQGEIDLAVHSYKDLETKLAHGLQIWAVLQREQAEDCFVGKNSKISDFFQLSPGATIGTASLRRQALIKYHRPDIEVQLLRGNINSRLEKLQRENLDGIILALAGLKRLQLQNQVQQILPVSQFVPAVAQGALALVGRKVVTKYDHKIWASVQNLNHTDTACLTKLERVILQLLDGSCKTPIGCHAALVSSDAIKLWGFLAKTDLSQPRFASSVVMVNDIRTEKNLRKVAEDFVVKLCQQ